EMRAHLKVKLPDYMIPSAFVQLEALPLTQQGKIDRAALPIPDWAGIEREVELVAPRTPIEEVLVGIWSDVLGVERVGIYDDFFDLGGHSLLAAQVMSRVREAFQVEMPLLVIFGMPCI